MLHGVALRYVTLAEEGQATMSWVRERRRPGRSPTRDARLWWGFIFLGIACFSLGASGVLEHVVAWLR